MYFNGVKGCKYPNFMTISRFENLTLEGKLAFIKLKAQFVEEYVLDNEKFVRVFNHNDFLISIVLKRSNIAIDDICTLDFNDEKILAEINIDELLAI